MKIQLAGIENLDQALYVLMESDVQKTSLKKGNEIGEHFYRAMGFKNIVDYDDDFMGYKLKTRKMELPIQVDYS